MDRFYWADDSCSPPEYKQYEARSTRLYDGDDKTSFDDGLFTVTTHRLLWKDSSNSSCVVALDLSLIANVEKHPGSFNRSPKIQLHLNQTGNQKLAGPIAHSRYSFVKISFKNHGIDDFYGTLLTMLQARQWLATPTGGVSSSSTSGVKPRIRGKGIVGIERKIEEKQRETNEAISTSFQDLSKLMEKAKEMVSLSQNIAGKIKDKQGDITEDETIKFKSYLLSLGIPNPVTKETHGSGTHYHMQLAKELSKLLLPVLEENGGIILLSDAYCRSNRARGMELISPDDMLNACRVMEHMKLPTRLRVFDSGVSVLQLDTHNDDKVMSQTAQLVEESTCLSAQQLANIIDISVVLAKERLLLAEKHGKVCRDDSVEGLKFFPNLFLTRKA